MVKPKKDMNAFDILCIERELQDLVGGNFDKCYQPSRSEVLLRFRAPERGRVDVIVGLGKYVFATERARDNPIQLPQFSKIVRKNLSGGKVLAVRQHEFDRVLVFEIGKADATYRIVVECFHNGNVVLVKDDTIVTPLIHRSWAHREVRPGRTYAFPPFQFNPRGATEPTFMERLRESDRELVRTLATMGNLGPEYAEEACLRADIDKRALVHELDARQLSKVVHTAREMIRKVAEEAKPVLVVDPDDESPLEASPIPLMLHGEDVERQGMATLSRALDEIFLPPAASGGKGQEGVDDQRLKELASHKARLEHQVADIEAKLEEFQEAEAFERKAGDILYAHFQPVETLLANVQAAHQGGGWGAVMNTEFAEGDVRLTATDPKHGKLTLTMPDMAGEPFDIEVEMTSSVGRNAEIHYDTSKEMRDKQEGARNALAKAKRELEEIEARGEKVLEEIERAKDQAQPTKQFWFDRFRWFVSSTGHLVVGGRDAKTNEQVVKKYLDDKDRYMHADVHGAPSVVIKARPEEDGDEGVPQTVFEEAAQFAVAFSKAWVSGVGQGEAYWVTPPQVTRQAQSGEFVPRGAFIIRGERNHVRARVQAGIGETTVEGHRKVMGGPVDAVKARCDKYVVFEPGRTPLGALASVLADLFEVPVEEVQAVLPPGPVSLLEVHGLDEGALREVEK